MQPGHASLDVGVEGLAYASELTRQNVADLLAILQWNRDHDIRFYRCTSTLVPWNSQFDLPDLPDYDAIERTARKCGALVEDAEIRRHCLVQGVRSEQVVARSVHATRRPAQRNLGRGL